MTNISEALSRSDEAAQDAIELVRKLIDAVVATPMDDGGPMRLEISGDLAVMLEQVENDGTAMAVAGSRYQRYSRPPALRETQLA